MSSYIRQIQANLKQAGLYQGDIDGIAGALTVKAVSEAIARGLVTDKVQCAVAEHHRSSPELVETLVEDAKKTSGFALSTASINRLIGVNNSLIAVVKHALNVSSQDFCVLEGLRTKERQAALVRKGASKTMQSKHITGHAVDLAPVINGEVSWDWKYFYPLASAMREAAKALDVQIRWGGAWNVLLNNTSTPTTELVKDYVALCKREGRKAFTDGPHFEMM